LSWTNTFLGNKSLVVASGRHIAIYGEQGSRTAERDLDVKEPTESSITQFQIIMVRGAAEGGRFAAVVKHVANVGRDHVAIHIFDDQLNDMWTLPISRWDGSADVALSPRGDRLYLLMDRTVYVYAVLPTR